MIALSDYLILGAILFSISLAGIFLNRKNIIILLMAIELMLLSVNINFIAFSHYLSDRALLVIRDQTLDAPRFLAAARLFGEPVRQHLERFNLPDCPDVATISNQEKTKDGKINVRGVSWHTDHSFQPEPPKATALFAVALPSTAATAAKPASPSSTLT